MQFAFKGIKAKQKGRIVSKVKKIVEHIGQGTTNCCTLNYTITVQPKVIKLTKGRTGL